MLYPALAIPLATGKRFEMPSDHIQAFRSALPEVDKVLTIGWAGKEGHFLAELADGLPSRVDTLVVNRDPDHALGTFNAMRDHPGTKSIIRTWDQHIGKFHVPGFEALMSGQTLQLFLDGW